MSDTEIEQINEKKLKAKGLAVKKEQEVKYNPEAVLFQLLEYQERIGLDFINTSKDIKNQIINYKQKKLQEENK